jgi:hypothetical protein
MSGLRQKGPKAKSNLKTGLGRELPLVEIVVKVCKWHFCDGHKLEAYAGNVSKAVCKIW